MVSTRKECIESGLVTTVSLHHGLGFMLTGDFIEQELGISPAVVTKIGKYWKPDDLDRVRIALAAYCLNGIGKK